MVIIEFNLSLSSNVNNKTYTEFKIASGFPTSSKGNSPWAIAMCHETLGAFYCYMSSGSLYVVASGVSLKTGNSVLGNVIYFTS